MSLAVKVGQKDYCLKEFALHHLSPIVRHLQVLKVHLQALNLIHPQVLKVHPQVLNLTPHGLYLEALIHLEARNPQVLTHLEVLTHPQVLIHLQVHLIILNLVLVAAEVGIQLVILFLGLERLR